MPATSLGLGWPAKPRSKPVFGPLDVQPLVVADLRPLHGARLSDADFRRASRRPRARPAPHRRHRRRPHGDRPFHDGGRAACSCSRCSRSFSATARSSRIFPPRSAGFIAPGDRRRDRAYSIFYVGINVGAFLAPLVCGTLGEEAGWHYGFAAAGVGMLIGLAIYLYAMPLLPPDELQKAQGGARATQRPLDRDEWRAVVALLVLFVPNTLFWATYEQQGNTIVAVGRRQHRPRRSICWLLDRRDSDDVVSGVQPVHDLRLHAVRRRAVDAAGGARHRAVDASPRWRSAVSASRAANLIMAVAALARGRAARRAGCGCCCISSSSPSASFISRRSGCRW